MLQEEKLDAFLDAFLDGKSDSVSVDRLSGKRKQKRQKEGFWDYQTVLAVPKGKGKLPKRTLFP